MAFDFNIYFLDLIAFVEKPNTFIALMPNTGYFSGNPNPMNVHAPLLAFYKNQMTEGNADFEIGQFGFWFLENVEISFPKLSSSTKLRPNPDQVAQDFPTKDNYKNFSWVSHMKEMKQKGQNPNKGYVIKDALESNENTKGLISSRLMIDNGKIETCFFASKKFLFFWRKIPKYKFEYKKFGRPDQHADFPPKALATCVKIFNRISIDHVTLKSSSFESREDPRSLKLELNGKPQVDIIYINLGGCCQIGPSLDHFENFYPLVNGWGSHPKYVPRKIKTPGSSKLVTFIGLPEIVKNLRNIEKTLCEKVFAFLATKNPTMNSCPVPAIMVDLESCPQVQLEPPE